MTERCLIAASLAVLAFHPSSTIRCFKPNPNPNPNPTSPQKEDTPPSKPHRSLKRALSLTKSKRKQDSHTNTPVSRTSSALSNTSVDPSPPAPPLLTRSGELFKPVSELIGGRPLTGIVETIFRSGWAEEIGVTVEKVLMVNNSMDVLNRFEEYREMVKSKAKENSVGLGLERLVADGNELLLFHGVVITCALGSDKGALGICSKKRCGVCRVIGSNFFVREDTARTTTSLCGNSWRAHEKVATECIANGVSPATRKGIILCKVIAGRVVRAPKFGLMDGEKGGFDSVVSSTGDQPDGSQDLMVLNPRAILPCFVIIYNVCKGTMFQ